MSNRLMINPELLTDILKIQAEDKPDTVALVFEGQTWTYSQLQSWSNKVSQCLISKQIKVGDRVIWLSRNKPSYWATFLGAARIGAVITPLNWRLAPAEVMQILVDCKAQLILAEDDLCDDLDRDQLPEILSLSSESKNDSFEKLVNDQIDQEPDHIQKATDAVLQLYTSGTTGLPKGVVLTNQCFHAAASDQREVGAISCKFENELMLNALPQFHIAGAAMSFIAWRQSMELIQHAQFDLEEILLLAKENKPINTFFVPAMISMLIECARKDGVSLDNFVCVSYGASPMPERLLLDAFKYMPKASFFQFYGMTETTASVSVLSAEDHLKSGPQRTSAGKVLPNCELKIIDVATGDELNQGETGEIIVRSNCIMQGYWNNPEATSNALKDGWYWTGDAGYVDGEGYLYVVDRIKDMVISGGENIYPAELENHLSKFPNVLECAVVGKPDQKWGEVVVAFIVLRNPQGLELSDVHEYLNGKIASFKLPKDIILLEALPRNASGKVLKTKLREMV